MVKRKKNGEGERENAFICQLVGIFRQVLAGAGRCGRMKKWGEKLRLCDICHRERDQKLL